MEIGSIEEIDAMLEIKAAPKVYGIDPVRLEYVVMKDKITVESIADFAGNFLMSGSKKAIKAQKTEL